MSNITIREWCPTCNEWAPVDGDSFCLWCATSTEPINGDLVSNCCDAHVKNADDIGRRECTDCGDNDVLTREVGA